MQFNNTFEIRHYQDIRRNSRNYGQNSLLIGSGFSCGRSPTFGFEWIINKMLANNPTAAWAQALRLFFIADLEMFLEFRRRSINRLDYLNEVSAIREAFVIALVQAHDCLRQLSSGEAQAVGTFIASFDNLFCLQCDAVLYWLDMEVAKIFDDGFRGIRGKELSLSGWTGSKRVYYLHGAVFIVRRNGRVVKIRRGPKSLIEEMQSSVSASEVDVILGPSSEEKLRMIGENPYLKSGLVALQRVTGAVTVFGASLSTTDDHLTRTLLMSNAGYLAIGVHDPQKNIARFLHLILHIENLARQLRPQRELRIQLFDSATVGLWTQNSQLEAFSLAAA